MTRAQRSPEPPLTGGISASSSPSPSTWSSGAYSRLTAITKGQALGQRPELGEGIAGR